VILWTKEKLAVELVNKRHQIRMHMEHGEKAADELE